MIENLERGGEAGVVELQLELLLCLQHSYACLKLPANIECTREKMFETLFV